MSSYTTWLFLNVYYLYLEAKKNQVLNPAALKNFEIDLEDVWEEKKSQNIKI